MIALQLQAHPQLSHPATQTSAAARPFSECLGVAQVDAAPCCRWEIPVLVGRSDVEDILSKISSKEAGKQQEQRSESGTTAPGR